MKKLVYFLNYISTNYNYLLHKEVKPKYLYYGQLQKKRINDMIETLNAQIKNFKQHKIKENFIFVEIGSYLGESLKLFGNEIHKNIKNYLLISIDPYSTIEKEKDIGINNHKQTNTVNLMDKNMSKIYNYFSNNVSNYSFKNNHFHLKTTSNNAFNILKMFNIKVDFCYLDGSHYYENIKNDYINYLSILKNQSNYSGIICGDDYELDLKDCEKYFNMTKNDFLKILEKNKKNDYIFLKTKEGINKKNKIGFHPGITLFFSEITDNIKKYNSGFWKKVN